MAKKPGGNLAEGIVERMTFPFMSAFAAFLETLTPRHALAFGVAEAAQARVLPQERLAQTPQGDLPLISRSRRHFQFPAGPGIMMLDCDVPKTGESYSEESLLAALDAACPELSRAPRTFAHSVSSHLWHGDAELLGQRGLRLYALVSDAQDILGPARSSSSACGWPATAASN